MSCVVKCQLPESALLIPYRESGCYTDCYEMVVDGTISHAEFISSFYTSALFKLERFALKYALSLNSTDAEVALLANGAVDSFAAWQVEQRCDNQLLLADYRGRTRSWLMTVAGVDVEVGRTYLYFGSAIVPANQGSEHASLGPLITGLLGFHKLYSQALLHAAKATIVQRRKIRN